MGHPVKPEDLEAQNERNLEMQAAEAQAALYEDDYAEAEDEQGEREQPQRDNRAPGENVPLTASFAEQLEGFQVASPADETEASEASAPAGEDAEVLTATIAEEIEAGEEPTPSPDPAAVAEQESHIEANAAAGDVAVIAHGNVTMDRPNEAGEAVSSAGSETATERSVKA
jgi:hypothetical protein